MEGTGDTGELKDNGVDMDFDRIPYLFFIIFAYILPAGARYRGEKE